MRVRAGTCDQNVFISVYHLNEYRLPETLNEDDVVIDIGSHIGSFSLAAHKRGARKIIAYEPNYENWTFTQGNTEGTTVVALNLAVWRNDVDNVMLRHAGFGMDRGELNTGGGSVFATEGEIVGTISLDSILRGFNTVRFLKLDCEGSEWPILYTSKELHRVQEIALEYHEFWNEVPEQAKVEGKGYKAEDMMNFLREQGFTITDTYRHGQSNLGMIFAKR